MKLPVYFDNHATTPVDPRVVDAMLPFFTEQFGNSASKHAFGWEAEAAVHDARKNIGSLIGAAPKEIVFTSGATESDNLAIKGVAELNGDRKDHIITCAAEHKAVLDCCKFLERHGYRVTYLPVDAHGTVDLDKLRAAIDDKTLLISIMAANNEVGTIQPLAEIGRIAQERGVLFSHGRDPGSRKMPIDVAAWRDSPALDDRSQASRAQGRRGALREREKTAGAVEPRHPRRRPRGRHAVGHP